jgi:hypothetical protein
MKNLGKSLATEAARSLGKKGSSTMSGGHLSTKLKVDMKGSRSDARKVTNIIVPIIDGGKRVYHHEQIVQFRVIVKQF